MALSAGRNGRIVRRLDGQRLRRVIEGFYRRRRLLTGAPGGSAGGGGFRIWVRWAGVLPADHRLAGRRSGGESQDWFAETIAVTRDRVSETALASSVK